MAESHEPASIAQIIAEDWERYALAVVAHAELSKRPFVVDWPALARWRDRVLANRRAYTPADVAAALECLALECHLSGQPELAAKATRQAEQLVLEHARRTSRARPYQEAVDAHG